MTSNENGINYKFIILTEIYNFDFGCFAIRGRLKILKIQITADW